MVGIACAAIVCARLRREALRAIKYPEDARRRDIGERKRRSNLGSKLQVIS
jgi:hypothetical protein